MIISLWRYSHLALAVSSFIFILSAAVSGIILAFAPISQELQGYNRFDLSQVNVGQTIQVLKITYHEVFNVTVNNKNAVSVSVLTSSGDTKDLFIDPITGSRIGDVHKELPVFQFARIFHRSLFFKSIGRFFVGVSSFLLFLISTTGVILILKNQQGLKRLFSRIVKENFYQYSHVYLGRLFLIPVILIALTGVYLSLSRFQVIPHTKLTHQVNYDSVANAPKMKVADFAAFKNIPLSEVSSIDFPFSPDETDSYQLNLKDKEMIVHQYTGEILSELKYPFNEMAYRLSWNLHTGEGSWVWSVILFIAALNILVAIYSGFKITFKRKQSKIRNSCRKDECSYVILVGSETGSTILFAMQLHQQLLHLGKKSYITDLNRYTRFKKMEHLLVITSTYGHGTAPGNADKFIPLFRQNMPVDAYSYSIVGFGSLAYPGFCQFALDMDQFLESDVNSTRLLTPYTIHNRSWESYRQWVRQWEKKVGLAANLQIKSPLVSKKRKKQPFKVIHKTHAADSPDDTFLVLLQGLKKQTYKSGDLLAVYPTTDEHERLYSIAVTKENDILLSIKRHEKGICSNYLNDLSLGSNLNVSIIQNPGFHFPSIAQKIVFISTGTGIVPFLGMLYQNHKQIETHLYWGARSEQSFELYKSYLEHSLTNHSLTRFVPAYSGLAKTYVQDLMDRDSHLMAQTLQENGIIMICGSIAMQNEVTYRLNQISMTMNGKPLSYYQNRNQLRVDCY